MTTFHYTAKNSDGQVVAGSLSAMSQRDAIVELESRGLENVELTLAVESDPAAKSVAAKPSSSSHLSNAEQIEVASGLRDIMESRVPLAAGLASLAEEVPSKSMRKTFRAMAAQLEAGSSLEEIGNQADSGLPQHLLGLIKAGARSGNIAAGLDHFVKFSRQQAAQRRILHSTMLYAYFTGVFALLLFFFLFGWTVPQFGEVFRDFETELPSLTELLLQVGDYTKLALDHWTVAIPVTVAIFYAIKLTLRTLVGSAAGRRVLYRLPLFGPMLKSNGIAEFCAHLALQVKSQVALPEALAATADGLRDANLREGALALSSHAKAGESLDKAALALPHFTQDVIHALSWERKEGKLADALHSVGELHAVQSEVAARNLQAAIEPVSVFVIGAIVLFAFLVLFMPLIKLLNDMV